MKLYILVFLGFIGFCCFTPGTGYSQDTDFFKGFINPAQEYWPGVRFAVQGNFDATNTIHLAGLESEIRELYKTGISTIEIQAAMPQADKTVYQNELKVFYRVGNELGMKMDLRVGGAGGIQGGIPQAIKSSEPLSVKDTYILRKGTTLNGVTNLRNATFDEKLIAVLAIRYTTEDNGDKILREVRKLNPTDFHYLASPEDNPIDEPSAENTGMPIFRRIIQQDNGQDIEEEFPMNMPEGGFPGRGPPDGGGPPPGFSHQRPGTTDHNVTITYGGDDITIGKPGETWDILAYYKAIDSDNVGMDNTDFYSQASVKVIIANTEALFDDELKKMIRENGKIGGRFAVDGGDQCQRLTMDTWSDELVAKVQQLHAYDFTDYIPVQYSGYKLENNNAVDRLNNDWREAFSYLFADYLTALEKWAKEKYFAAFRGQYGFSTHMDAHIVCQAVTQPDVESFWPSGGASIEDFNLEAGYLAMTSVSNILRKKITAGNELGAIPEPHGASWIDFLLVNVNKAIYSGVNKMIYHCIDAQYGNAWGTAYDLSGYMSWGNVNPQFSTSSEFNDYVKRSQYILHNGVAERDLLVYDHVYKDSYQLSYPMDKSLIEAGYNYDLVSPSLLETENLQIVSHGMVDPDGGRYKALVIKHLLDGLQGNYMPFSSAETILKYAKAGIPIIIVGNENYPTRTMSFSNVNNDDRLAEIFKQIEKLGKLQVIESDKELVKALKNAGVQPNLKKNKPGRIVSYKRVIDNTSCYFLYNYAVEGQRGTITQTISLKGTGTPYSMNLWSGTVTPIANYEKTDDGCIKIDVTLNPNEACLIAISDDNKANIHATEVSHSMNLVYNDEGEIQLKATESGDYEITLSDGSIKKVKVKSVAKPLTLTNWTLQVESWMPTYGFGRTPDDPTYSKGGITTKTKLKPVQLTGLKSWTEIKEIGPGISGVGIYSTSFEIDGKYNGACIELGKIYETALLFVNGQQVYLNQSATMTADIGEYLIKGINTIEIQSPSDLQNVLLTNRGQYTKKDSMQDYGLLGPVVIKPYVTKSVK
jgi:hypothetical protein